MRRGRMLCCWRIVMVVSDLISFCVFGIVVGERRGKEEGRGEEVERGRIGFRRDGRGKERGDQEAFPRPRES